MIVTSVRDRLARTSLLVRFGVSSALLVIGLGLVLGRVLGSTVDDRALSQSESMATSIGQLGVQPLLRSADFESGVISTARHEQLDEAMAQVVAAGSVARVKVFGRDGTLLYSDEPELIGQRQEPDAGLAAALDGQVASELQAANDTDTPTEGDLSTLLEVYAPITMAGEVVGAFELYLPYAPVAAQARADVVTLAWWLVLGLLVLWLGLFQIMVSTARRLRRQALENARLAEHDGLTGLPNRRLFSDRAEQAILAAGRRGGDAAILIADLDRFKDVNDTLGHHIGDRLIAAVGVRLSEQLREADTVARLGGDEFAVLLPDVAGVDGAREAAARVVASLRAPFLIDGISLEVDTSVGVACYPEHGLDVAHLLRCADVAMYSAKHVNRTVMAYDPAQDMNTPARLALYGELRRGIDQDELTLHYQPKVDVVTRRVLGAEALVRWHHPERGLMQPDDFIPLAEQTGLIRPMTLWVLRTALRECRSWRKAGHELTVAVNLSVRSLLDETLAAEVAALLLESGLPASALELEITETMAMVDPIRSMVVLGKLRALGVTLSLDDYGTGHSSLAYLNELPVDTLKIDKSFVSAMGTSSHDETIVRSTIDLARNLGLHVVAEGVETKGSWRTLTELGCDSAQGYWLARPEPAERLLAVVKRLERRLSAETSDAPLAV